MLNRPVSCDIVTIVIRNCGPGTKIYNRNIVAIVSARTLYNERRGILRQEDGRACYVDVGDDFGGSKMDMHETIMAPQIVNKRPESWHEVALLPNEEGGVRRRKVFLHHVPSMG